MDNICFDKTSFYFSIIIICIILYLLFKYYINNDDKNNVSGILNRYKNDLDVIKDKYNDLSNNLNKCNNNLQKEKTIIITAKDENHQNKQNNDLTIEKRDRQVLYDQLYPPLARTERPVADNILNTFKDYRFNVSTRGYQQDTPRLLGHFYKDNNPREIYKLYGWAKNPGNTLGYFYYTYANDNYNVKIPLDDKNSNLKRIDDLPLELKISKGPINGEFKLDELPKSDLSSGYY